MRLFSPSWYSMNNRMYKYLVYFARLGQRSLIIPAISLKIIFLMFPEYLFRKKTYERDSWVSGDNGYYLPLHNGGWFIACNNNYLYYIPWKNSLCTYLFFPGVDTCLPIYLYFIESALCALYILVVLKVICTRSAKLL